MNPWRVQAADRQRGGGLRHGAAGAIGALLRREGLYSSHLTTWRRAGARGELVALAPKKRRRKPTPIDPRADQWNDDELPVRWSEPGTGAE
jgi:hypothetical protein